MYVAFGWCSFTFAWTPFRIPVILAALSYPCPCNVFVFSLYCYKEFKRRSARAAAVVRPGASLNPRSSLFIGHCLVRGNHYMVKQHFHAGCDQWLPKFHDNSVGALTRFILVDSFLFMDLKVCYI